MPGHNLIGDYKAAGNKKARAGNAVEQEKDARRQKNAERQQAENRGHKPRPARQRQAPERHAFRAEVDQRCNEI